MPRFCFFIVLMLVGCARELDVPDSLDFGDTARGSESVRSFVLHNTGATRSLSLTTDSSDFTVSPTEATLASAQRLEVRVAFSPRSLGPRTASLSLGSGAPSVLLRGGSTGPLLQTPSVIELPTAALVDGAPEVVSGSLVVRNVGTLGSTLSVTSVTGPGLCLGTLRAGACQAVTVPPLSAGASFSLPIALQVVDDTPRSWSVTLETDDPEHLRVELPVRVAIERVSRCEWSGPTSHRLADPRALTFTHRGAAPCLLRELATSDDVEVRGPTLPKLVSAGEAITVSLTQRRFFEAGTLELRSAGTPPFIVTLEAEQCLHVEPAALQFSTVKASCASPVQAVQLINTCAREVVVHAAEVPRPFVLAGPAAPLRVGPTSQTTLLVQFLPDAPGSFTGGLIVSTDSGTLVVGLAGLGDVAPDQRDVFRDEPLPSGDVLVLVDTSPSFVPKRAAVRTNLEWVLRKHESPCLDVRWALAPADRSAGVEFARTDAGTTWVSSADPLFVERVLSAYDALPVGSEDEACVEPAVNLLTDAGVRTQGVVSALCITDAPEAPGAFARFTDFEGLRPAGFTSWSVVGPLATSTCPVEASDDGVHAALVNRSSGILADICDVSWASSFGPPTHGGGCGRSRYFLTSTPSGPITVLIGGVIVPTSGWWFDAATNSVALQPWVVPPPGATVELVYRSGC